MSNGPATPHAPLIAAFDVGSTAAKLVLVARDRGIAWEGTVPYATHHGPEGQVEQAPEDWWGAAVELARRCWDAGQRSQDVLAIALTGQMQDLILLDERLEAIGPAILYSDARAVKESDAIRATLAARGVDAAPTTYLDPTSPLAKLIWLQRRRPETTARCRRLLFGAKDYLAARLAGVVAGDHTTAATTGFYDIEARRWHRAWFGLLGLPEAWLPPLLPQTAPAGVVGAAAAALTGFRAGTPVFPGMGDAAAATLSAGLVDPGDSYLYLGTTAWAAALERTPGPETNGLRYLPAAHDELTIKIAPLLNAGSAQQWIIGLLGLREPAGSTDPGASLDYAAFERLLRSAPERSEGALFLPYLNGERCPVQESRAMGTFVGLSTRSGPAQLGWSVMEGVSFALREVLETLGATGTELRILGGMARSPMLRQLVADCCNRTVHAPRLPQAAGAMAAAVPVAVASGWFPTPAAAVAQWFPARDPQGTPAAPDPRWADYYAGAYLRYRRIYPLVSQLA